ncbi:hypothetical protein [Salinivibrio sp. YCSC6]|uniref:hypothetical protein n=1 Tax=Salinivibrio sp. YCSC6 TaxID=2003370 RepID=UPI000BCB1F53|nr:hypothetical protein [Salinivibrio sp. YCSC6]PCE67992.1 hypothetical protein B6G00_06625 [Salinivibrio sp. YCSC6]QCF35113.1 hypothetical protein E8E00_02360 [Salinivibrio sp. YCSC6]
MGLWGKHSDWAELGAFFSGVYSPLIAFLALLVLSRQKKAQDKMDKHYYDTAFLVENKKELHYYLERLEEYLDKPDQSGVLIRDKLLTSVGLHSKEQLDIHNKEISNFIYFTHPKAMRYWLAIKTGLQGLDSINEASYKNQLAGSLLKISTVLSYEMCVTLDKISYCSDYKSPKQCFYFWHE